MKGSASRTAALYLARLFYRTDRPAESRQLLNSYLNTYAADAAARSLRALVESRIASK
jgi:hypothetical protein